VISWRTAAIVLGLMCCIQRWQSCTRTTRATTVVETHTTEARVTPLEALASAVLPEAKQRSAAGSARTFFGFRPPAWAQRFLPQTGETMRAYRERIVPIAQLVIAPQRVRVARLRDQFDTKQRAELDAATDEAATAIEARITSAVMAGDLQTLRPMTGVSMARDVLDIVDRGNARFATSLTPDQHAHFDFADYLVFATHWEDALPP
jgi:hypothetical protein